MVETLAKDCKAKSSQMVWSPTWIKNNLRFRKFIRVALAFGLFVSFVDSHIGFSQSTQQSHQSPTKATQNAFLVSTTVPYRFPPTSPESQPTLSTLSAAQIGQLASERSGAAKSLNSDSRSRSLQPQSLCNDSDSEKEIVGAFQAAVVYRLRQTASANAMKLHYGIAACLTAENIFNETATLLDEQDKAQSLLVEKGIPIPDPHLVGRLKISLEDKRLENHSKMVILRSQLSALIGTENACSHTPVENQEIIPSDRDVCEHITQATACRCDLRTMNRLRGTINADTLAVWDRMGAKLSGVPSLAKPKTFWPRILFGKSTREEIQSAVGARRNWIDELIAEQTRQIALEVDVAFEKKKTAALRWVKANEQIDNWENRIKQLEMISEVQGNIASQFEANLNRKQAEGPKIERWLEWRFANIDLMLAVGCDL